MRIFRSPMSLFIGGMYAVVALVVMVSAGALGSVVSAGTALAAPTSTVTVQDQGGSDGALVDTDGTPGNLDSDGTQGDFRSAMQGSASGPIMVATPQG